jgi:hypothetical protein
MMGIVDWGCCRDAWEGFMAIGVVMGVRAGAAVDGVVVALAPVVFGFLLG